MMCMGRWKWGVDIFGMAGVGVLVLSCAKICGCSVNACVVCLGSAAHCAQNYKITCNIYTLNMENQQEANRLFCNCRIEYFL